MNLIRDQGEIVAIAELGKLDEFVFAEDAAERILRIAEDEDTRLGRDGLFHGVPVKGPTAAFEDMGDFDQVKLAVPMNAQERWINRGAGHERIARFCKGATRKRKGGHESSQVNDMLRNFGLMAAGKIGENGFVETCVRKGVSKDAVRDAALKGLDHFRGGLEIHVCHPEWLQIRALVPLQGTSATAGIATSNSDIRGSDKGSSVDVKSCPA